MGSVFVGAETKSQNTPTPSPGYKTQLEILSAFGNGKLEIVEWDMPLPDGIELEKDIEYGNADVHSLQFDLYRPAKITTSVPTLLFIYCGAWKSGKRQDYHFYTTAFDKLTFPAAVQDCKCVVRWLRANAKKYNIDPAQIAVIGGSAGGHL